MNMIRGRLLALIFVFAQASHAENYCLALRGNGELMPAHWGAMANLTEKLGLPVAQAGGSSATITMMLNEAVASNRFVGRATGEQRKKRAALLYKSFEGFLEYLTATPEWRDFITLYERAKSTGGSTWMESLENILERASEAGLAQNVELVKRNYQTGVRLGLISESNYAPLYKALGRLAAGETSTAAEDLATAKFYAGELKETIRVFGAFDAKTDANLFFRPGIVDFTVFGRQLGRMAQFYSSLSATPADDVQWEDFFKACEDTAGLLWGEIKSARPECGRRLDDLVRMFLKAPNRANFSERYAGLSIKTFPTTAVLTGQGADEALEAMRKYAAARDSQFGFKFYLSDSESVRFGYWGDPAALAQIDANLPKATDEKSRRFLALGDASWSTILGLSPAEPGLSAMQAFSLDGKTAVSAGGWSDLHPVTVLRAAGCERVVYVTRRGGESPFAQGVAKRLLSTRDGDPQADELLRKLYDLGNPETSMRKALDQADAVLCTDWNRFDIKAGVKDMIRDSYRASPYFVRNRRAFSASFLLPELNPRDSTPDGKLVYEGCF
jgi:hypothetical protein